MIFTHISPRALKIAKPEHDLVKLFWAASARRVATSFLQIFSSIYVFEIFISLGFSVKKSLIFIALYMIVTFSTKLFALNFAEDFSQKVGFKSTIRASIYPFLIYILLMIFASSSSLLLFFAPIFWGIHAGLFWWGYHGYFIKSGHLGHYGENLGEAGFLETMASIIAPIFGAIIASFVGFNSIFVLSGLFMLLSLLALGKDHEKRQKVDISGREVIKNILSHKSISLAYVGNGGEGVLAIIFWPLFLYLTFNSLTELGWLITLANLLTSVFAIYLGRWADSRKEKVLVEVGTPLMATSWVVRLFTSIPVFYAFADSIRLLGERMVTVPLNVLSYEKAFEGKSSARAILFRETNLILGANIALAIFALWVFVFGDMRYWFVIPALFILLPMVAIAKKRIV